MTGWRQRMSDTELRARIRLDPHRRGQARARLANYDVPVWAIIQHMIAENNLADIADASPEAIADAAHAYRIPEQAVRAAIAYYGANRVPIDALIAINADALGGR
jgi:uncharacterized protein (DUF433 family)